MSVSPARQRVRLSVPGTIDGVREALDAFEAFSRKLALPEQARWRFLVALDEVLANVVHHGMRDRQGLVGVTYSLVGGVLRVEVVDTADAFNPLLMAEPDTVAPLEERRVGGLGIALVRGLMDRVVYERRAGRNRLTLSWKVRLADPPAPSPSSR